jgi:hypothetical protein
MLVATRWSHHAGKRQQNLPGYSCWSAYSLERLWTETAQVSQAADRCHNCGASAPLAINDPCGGYLG